MKKTSDEQAILTPNRREGSLLARYHAASKPEESFSAVMRKMIKRRETPMELNQMVDAALAYRPKPKSKAAKKRRRKAAKKAKG
jgi:predicted CopG family antitoxin